MDATRPISFEDRRADLRGHASIAPIRGSGPSPKQHQPLLPIAQSTVEPEEPNAVRPISPENLDATVSKLRDYVQSIERSLRFSVDDDSGRTMIKVMDAETDELIRQIPSEEALNILRHITASGEDGAEVLQGFLVREKA